jgi:hypothetical protein
MKYDEEGNPIRQSRWVKKSDVPRFDKEQQKGVDAVKGDIDGWFHGARCRKVS